MNLTIEAMRALSRRTLADAQLDGLAISTSAPPTLGKKVEVNRHIRIRQV